jgi:hypothetical protein
MTAYFIVVSPLHDIDRLPLDRPRSPTSTSASISSLVGLQCPAGKRANCVLSASWWVPLSLVEHPLREPSGERLDIRRVRRFAVEGQHATLRRDRDAIAVLDRAVKDHLGEWVRARRSNVRRRQLQQHVEHVRMRLLDLVEQHHLIGQLPYRFGERATSSWPT